MSTAQTRNRQSYPANAQGSLTESAKRQVGQASDIAKDAVISGTWAYPLWGILYLLSHPALIKPLLPALFKGLLLSIGVVAAMFTLAYLPQVAVLAFVSGPLAFLAAVPLVLGEAYIIINFVTRAFLLGQVNIDLFDAVLLQKGCIELVQRGRQVTNKAGAGKQIGKVLTKPLARFNTDSIVRYVLTLPLNFVPVVGTVFFLGFNGYKSGPAFHARYFQLKSYDKDKRQAVVAKRRGAYTAFGVVAMILGLIPALSILFQFTNNVGAALWAADIDNKVKRTPTGVTHGNDEISSAQSNQKMEL